MPADERPVQPSPDDVGDPALVAAAVRAGIDALLIARAPAERDAFWQAVALHYARDARPPGQPGPPAIFDAAETSDPGAEILR